MTPTELIPANFNSAKAIWAMVQRLQHERLNELHISFISAGLSAGVLLVCHRTPALSGVVLLLASYAFLIQLSRKLSFSLSIRRSVCS